MSTLPKFKDDFDPENVDAILFYAKSLYEYKKNLELFPLYLSQFKLSTFGTLLTLIMFIVGVIVKEDFLIIVCGFFFVAFLWMAIDYYRKCVNKIAGLIADELYFDLPHSHNWEEFGFCIKEDN